MCQDVRRSSVSSSSSQGKPSNQGSNYSQINSSLQARVKAFQEQRQLKRSGSIHSNQSQSSVQIQQMVNKPLPPLPQKLVVDEAENVSGDNVRRQISSETEIELKDTSDTKTVHIEDSQGGKEEITEPDLKGPVDLVKMPISQLQELQLNPIRQAPRPPQHSHSQGLSMGGLTNVNTAKTGGAVVDSTGRLPHEQPHLQKAKQSLSARRGLKLPPGGMSLKLKPTQQGSQQQGQHEFTDHTSNLASQGKRSNPGSLINGIQTTSSSAIDGPQDTDGTEPKSNSNSNSGIGGLFANFSKYVNIKSGSLNFAGKLSLSSRGIDFSNGSSFRITLDELEFLEELGHGNYGNVSKVLHKPTQIIMAMKEVRLELDEAKFRQILMELEVLHKCQSPYIVDFYGAFFIEGAVYMCMEYMDGGSLDKSYDQEHLGGIDEPQLARITSSVIQGLKELKDVHNIIHRDVKPTNILCSASQGTVKLCDFGVSGNLVASLAKTNIGCQSYMAPERIKSLNPDKSTYSVQSDIWSLGLSILEMALGAYPYPPETFDNIFSQLSAIVDGPPPKLPEERFSSEAQSFVSMCLQKVPERRPTYASLLEHPWLKKYENVDVKISAYITERLNKRKQWLAQTGEEIPKNVPALHMGGIVNYN